MIATRVFCRTLHRRRIWIVIFVSCPWISALSIEQRAGRLGHENSDNEATQIGPIVLKLQGDHILFSSGQFNVDC